MTDIAVFLLFEIYEQWAASHDELEFEQEILVKVLAHHSFCCLFEKAAHEENL